MNVRATAALACACMALMACDMRVPATTTTRITNQTCMHRVMDAATRARFEQALASKSVKYEVVEPTDGQGGVFLRARGADCDALQEIQGAIDGPDLPNGRHMAFDPRTQAEFKAWLTEQGIPYQTRLRDDHEYVIWNAADTERVVRWRHFPRDLPGYAAPPTGVQGKDPGTKPRS
jgi:hypothetical protein